MPKYVRYLSQRRRNQIIYQTSHNSNISLESVLPNVLSNNVVEEVAKSINSDKVFCNNNISFEDRIYQSEESSESSESSVELESRFENNEKYTDLQDNIALTDNEQSLREDLQRLIINHNIPHSTANELLKILRKHGHVELPGDVRVLVQTPRNASINIKCMGNGRYVHFGVASALKRSIEIYSKFIKTDEIKININIDGLPISKSSGSQLWPIMASIENISIHTSPFIIGMYHGMCKPNDANDFHRFY